MRLDPAVIKQQVDNLLAAYPELLEDEVLRADMVYAETDLREFVAYLERQRQDRLTKANALGNYIDELKQRKARFERSDDAIRAVIFRMLQTAQQKRMELPEATFSIRIGVPKVVIVDEAELPDEYVRIKREPDKIKIKEALSHFTPVPGATLSNAEDVLSIRTK